jgi:Biotin/lipoate A/B protein ligase family
MNDASRLSLPPPYAQRRLGKGDALEAAIAAAAADGAGTLLWRVADGVAAFAVTLEPETPLREARMAFFAGMAALADALAAHCPPERGVRIFWPATVIYDRARLGGARFATPEGCAEDAVPDWLAFAVELIADRDAVEHPGEFPETTSLKEEGFDAPEAVIESFASYLMLYFDRWTHQGLGAVTERYLERLDPPLLAGTRSFEGCDLLERSPSGAARWRRLAEGLAAAGWRGPAGPRL